MFPLESVMFCSRLQYISFHFNTKLKTGSFITKIFVQKVEVIAFLFNGILKNIFERGFLGREGDKDSILTSTD